MKYPETESSTVELKREMPKNDQIIKTVIAFANQHGGRLVIGVADDGTIVGIPEAEVASAIETLHQTLYEACAPPILPVIYSQTCEDKMIVLIEVAAGTQKPYFRKMEGLAQGTYIRLGPSTFKATAELIEELQWQARGKSYDSLPVYSAALEELDEKKISEFLKRRKGKKEVPISPEVLSSYYLTAQEHARTYATVAGLLLFGKRPQHFLSEAFIICSHFKGVEGREALASIECTGTLFEQLQTAEHFILSRLSSAFVIKGMQREETLEVPVEAVREALLNALVHRNYHINSSIKIAIFDDRIEFFSPGAFMGPFNEKTLKLGVSCIRNIAICKAFREVGYIEKLGTGLLTLFRAYEERGLETPSVIEGPNFVKCILPRKSQEKALEDRDLEEVMVLFRAFSKITISDVMKRLKLSRTTASRRLAKLLCLKKIAKVGKGRGAGYCNTVSR